MPPPEVSAPENRTPKWPTVEIEIRCAFLAGELATGVLLNVVANLLRPPRPCCFSGLLSRPCYQYPGSLFLPAARAEVHQDGALSSHHAPQQ